ncbi:hypothetical protein DCAR_0727169 [Daucus carota subsp. sativus]|uniref:hAT-like transposase RNase-H fold domain-containing protein n=1 Tax=Daucus carota subsp. sativus TaxID=79200 RepID=A0AAF0XGF7_DAUCS|nr:hypothetical protein DCAR_0727169 [Daucus carota subsp. sativus]
MNKLIYVTVVVDPRYKLEFIEFALGEEYGKEEIAQINMIDLDMEW